MSTPTLEEASLRHAAYYAAQLREAEHQYTSGAQDLRSSLDLLNRDLGNIQAGQAWAERFCASAKSAARLCSNYAGFRAQLLNQKLSQRECVRWHKAAATAARSFGQQRREAVHLGNLAVAYAAIGEFGAAKESNKQVKRLSRMIGNRAHEEKALMNLGSVFCKEGKLRVAVKCFRRSLNLARQLGNRQAELASLTNLGSTYAMLGETNRTIELLRLALFLYLKNGDRLNESRVLCNLGSVYADSNDPQRAIDFYRESLKTARETGYRTGEAIALWNISLLLHKLNRRAEAIAGARAALEIYELSGDHRAALVREQLARWLGEEPEH